MDTGATKNATEDKFLYAPHVLQVREDECLLLVKATSDDVLCVFMSKTVSILNGEVLPEKFLIISHLYHKWYIEHIL